MNQKKKDIHAKIFMCSYAEVLKYIFVFFSVIKKEED